MLEYSKIILEKVRFDLSLFSKEFKKALSRIEHPEERKHLIEWVRNKYSIKQIESS